MQFALVFVFSIVLGVISSAKRGPSSGLVDVSYRIACSLHSARGAALLKLKAVSADLIGLSSGHS